MKNILEIAPTNTYTPSVIETKNGIILMGQYYSKNLLQPSSLAGFNLIGNVGTNILNIKTSTCIDNNTGMYDHRHNAFGIYQDSYMTDIYYILINSHYSNDTNNYNPYYKYLVVLQEKNLNVEVLNVVTFDRYMTPMQIFDENKNYLFIVSRLSNTFYIHAFNKNTYAKTQIMYNNGTKNMRSNFVKLYSNNKYSYLITHYGYSTWTIIRVDKDNLNANYFSVNLYNGLSDVNLEYMNSVFENVYENNNKYYVYQIYDSSHPQIIGLEFDSTKDFNSYSVRQFVACTECSGLRFSRTDYHYVYRNWIIDSYLYLLVYNEYYNNSYSIIDYQGLYTYKINSDGTLEFIDYNQISKDKDIISVCYSSDRKMLIICYFKQFQIALYDEDTHLYSTEGTHEYSNVSCVGFDELDRIWVRETDASFHVYDINEPQNTNAIFEKPLYVYRDTDIQSFIQFEATNLIGRYAIGEYHLELEGSAYFTDNSSNEITFHYDGDIQKINITVTGDEQLSCKVYYLKGGD